MCDTASGESKRKDAARASACSVVHTDSTATKDIVKAKNAISVKSEREVTEDVAMSPQTESRWIREAVDPTFTLKPLEYQVKHALDIDTKDGILFQALSFDAFPAAGPERKRKNDDGQSSQETLSPSDAPYFCELCNRKFTRQSNLTEHMLRHAGKVYECDLCLKKFSCLRYLTRHSRIHSGDQLAKKESPKAKSHEHKSYVCVFCNKKFSCKSHLVAHTRIHTGEKPYSCGICQKTFNHKSHLTAHTRIHTGERPFQCRICQKHFRDPSNLAGHMRVHNGQKPFACQYCSEQFSHRAQLKKHERGHLDETHAPPACSECGKVVTDASKLKNHMKVHSAAQSNTPSSKFYACNFCNGQFETKRGQDKTVACEVCTKQFTERIRLQERGERREERAYMIYAVGDQ